MPKPSEKKYVAAESKPGRLVVARITPETELVQGIVEVCKAYGIKSGILINAIGTLRKAAIRHGIPNEKDPLGVSPSPDLLVKGPVELGSCQGLVCEDEEGKVVVHLHASVMDQAKNVYSGHIMEKGNPVAVTVDVSILEAENIRIVRRYDPKVGRLMTQPESTG